jgi:hypothetical protein
MQAYTANTQLSVAFFPSWLASHAAFSLPVKIAENCCLLVGAFWQYIVADKQVLVSSFITFSLVQI